MKSYKFIITGKVQRVYYRKSVANNSTKAKFSGYVKNLPNGNVEAVVSCEKKRLNEFISTLNKGSIHSKVNNIKQSTTKGLYSKGFNDSSLNISYAI